MDTKYIEENTNCPSAKEYKLYLNGKGSDSFIAWFETHLKNCELCNEAIEGYKLNHLLTNKFDLAKSVKPINNSSLKRVIPYAAAVAVLFAIILASPVKEHLFKNNYLAEDIFAVQNNYNKKLMHKSTAEYWYISESDNISLNDQFISKDDIEATRVLDSNNEVVFVQVESNSIETTQAVISKIKENHSVPVYTYSKHKGLKKN